MIFLLRFLSGYIKFEFTKGFCEGFINDCYKKDIKIRNLSRDGGILYGCCSVKTYKNLHRIAYINGGKVKILKKKGLPFILHPLKNRFGFFTGMVMFVFILSFLSGFVWNVELVGNSRISDITLYTYLENHHVYQGAMWSGIDRKDLAWKMMGDFEDISWVHINKIGTTARVEINETKKQPTGNEDKLKGKRIFRKELESVAYRTQSKMAVKSRKNYIAVQFFNLKIPLYTKQEKGDMEQVEKHFAVLNGITLPIGCTKTEQIRLRAQNYELEDDQLKALALKKLEYLAEQELDGYEIINKTVDTDLQEDKCVATGAYIIRDNS